MRSMENTIKFFHWFPRILGILAILFISLFALDAFDPELALGQQIKGFLIHMIPSFILAILLALAWKWELPGGIVFALIGLVMTPVIFKHNYTMNDSIGMTIGIVSMITIPFVVVGILFIVSYWLKKKNKAGPPLSGDNIPS
jgi:hypothetical protein